MHFTRVSRSELIAIVGGIALAVGLFLSWYTTSGLGRIDIGSHKQAGTFSAWQVHTIMRYLLLAAAAAPLILTYIVIRGHALSWPRGEMTAVVAIAAFGMIGYNGFITRPGSPRSLISLEYGFFVALVGSLLMLVGSARRSSENERRRKPPGAL